jgi:copper chaperone CopZ
MHCSPNKNLEGDALLAVQNFGRRCLARHTKLRQAMPRLPHKILAGDALLAVQGHVGRELKQSRLSKTPSIPTFAKKAMSTSYNTSLKCEGCVNSVRNGLNELLGKDSWEVDLEAPIKTLKVPETTKLEDLKPIFERVGHHIENRS